MSTIEEYRSRLAALTSGGIETPDATPGEALAACRVRLEELRKLKKEVLAHLLTLRSRARELARKSLDAGASGAKPSLGELWDRRDEGARALLDDVRQRVKEILDDDDAEAVEEWAQISRGIDAAADGLRQLEQKLGRAAGEAPVDLRPPARRRPGGDAEDDDLYAAVGAAVQEKGTRGGAFCPQCGQPVEPDDRFCRRCGHRLA